MKPIRLRYILLFGLATGAVGYIKGIEATGLIEEHRVEIVEAKAEGYAIGYQDGWRGAEAHAERYQDWGSDQDMEDEYGDCEGPDGANLNTLSPGFV